MNGTNNLVEMLPVINNNCVCSRKIYSQPTSSCRQQKTESGRVFGIEPIYSDLPFSSTNFTINPLIEPFLINVCTKHMRKYAQWHTLSTSKICKWRNEKKRTQLTVIPCKNNSLPANRAYAETEYILTLYALALWVSPSTCPIIAIFQRIPAVACNDMVNISRKEKKLTTTRGNQNKEIYEQPHREEKRMAAICVVVCVCL